MKKIKHFVLLTFCFQLSAYGYSSYERFTFECSISSTCQSAVNSVNNEITLISIDEKTVYVLISTNGIVDQSHYSNAEEVNVHFLNTEGLIECSYSWNNNMMKLVLDRTKAKEILINNFGFAPDIIANLF